MGPNLPTRIWVRSKINLLKKPLWICQSGWKEIGKRTFSKLLSLFRVQNKDLGVASQVLLSKFQYIMSAMQATKV